MLHESAFIYEPISTIEILLTEIVLELLALKKERTQMVWKRFIFHFITILFPDGNNTTSRKGSKSETSFQTNLPLRRVESASPATPAVSLPSNIPTVNPGTGHLPSNPNRQSFRILDAFKPKRKMSDAFLNDDLNYFALVQPIKEHWYQLELLHTAIACFIFEKLYNSLPLDAHSKFSLFFCFFSFRVSVANLFVFEYKHWRILYQ